MKPELLDVMLDVAAAGPEGLRFETILVDHGRRWNVTQKTAARRVAEVARRGFVRQNRTGIFRRRYVLTPGGFRWLTDEGESTRAKADRIGKALGAYAKKSEATT